MIQLDITPDDVAVLKESLEKFLSDLRYEINDTDAQDYREILKLKQISLERVIAQLGES